MSLPVPCLLTLLSKPLLCPFPLTGTVPNAEPTDQSQGSLQPQAHTPAEPEGLGGRQLLTSSPVSGHLPALTVPSLATTTLVQECWPLSFLSSRASPAPGALCTMRNEASEATLPAHFHSLQGPDLKGTGPISSQAGELHPVLIRLTSGAFDC